MCFGGLTWAALGVMERMGSGPAARAVETKAAVRKSLLCMMVGVWEMT